VGRSRQQIKVAECNDVAESINEVRGICKCDRSQNLEMKLAKLDG
jgi:hypothetical protein